jgi:hypothetical protein
LAEIAEQSAKDLAAIQQQTATVLASIKAASDLHDASTVKGMGQIASSADKATR